MATNLSWNEKLNVFQIDPQQATLEDISKMATELSDRASKVGVQAEVIPKIAEEKAILKTLLIDKMIYLDKELTQINDSKNLRGKIISDNLIKMNVILNKI